MESSKEIQEAIETSRQGDESESPKEIKGGRETSVDYLDLIDEKNTKLSGIIDCIRGFKGEAGDEDLGNLGWAMHDFTEAIQQLSDDLMEHLRDIGVPEIERAKQESEA